MRRHRKIMFAILSLLILAALVVSCAGPHTTPRPTPTRTTAPTISAQPRAERNTVLPLAVGNTWTYAKTVSPGKIPKLWLELQMRDGGVGHFIDVDFPCDPGTYIQTFTVVKQIDESTWDIEFTSKPGKCEGHYRDANRILWSWRPGVLAPYVEERVTYDRRAPPLGWHIPQWPDEGIDPPTHKRIILWDPREKGVIFRVPRYKFVNAYYGDSSEPWKTPAGAFDCCLVIREVVEPQKADFPGFPEESWQNIRVFCLGVGLVREVQIIANGEEVYRMELASQR